MAIEWRQRDRVLFSAKDIDVKITVSKPNVENPKLNIFIRPDLKEIITDTDYIIYGYDREKNFLYLDRATKTTGYMLCKGGKNSREASFNIKPGEQKKYSTWIGDYRLLEDTKLKLHYIDLSKKIY